MDVGNTDISAITYLGERIIANPLTQTQPKTAGTPNLAPSRSWLAIPKIPLDFAFFRNSAFFHRSVKTPCKKPK
jgi:hypothetical protein